MRRQADKQEKKHMDRVASLGCVVCRNLGLGASPSTVHHVRHGQGAGQRAGHFLTIPLCKLHHQDGGYGVAIHAGQEHWESLYGSELELLNKTIRDLEVRYG